MERIAQQREEVERIDEDPLHDPRFGAPDA
jgi:hypothetical protein